MIFRTSAGRLVVAVIAALLVGCTTANPSPSPSVGDVGPSSSPAGATAQPTTAEPTDTGQATGRPTSGATTPPEGTPAPTDSPVPTRPPTPAGSFDPGAITLTTERFASGFRARLTFATHAGDGSGTLYAVTQLGTIVAVTPGDTQTGLTLLDIRERVGSGGERGLLGLAFHPDFDANGRFFVDYTNTSGNTVISEFVRAADGTVDAAAERVLLRVNQPFSNHNGGMIAFGPDGYLYVALGDGGSANDPQGNGQNLGTHLGKILRIDVDSGDTYGIPADNPFADGPNGALPEIWSYGVRNPWRFTFDPATGAMFMADVGQNQLEEINVEPRGAGGRNYGWSIMEGDRCLGRGGCSRRGLTEPVAVYSHDQGCSVTGGYVYRGGSFPQLFGGYVFADYCSGQLWAFDAERALNSGTADVWQLGVVGFATSSFGEDEAGELYVVDHGGAIHRLVAVPR